MLTYSEHQNQVVRDTLSAAYHEAKGAYLRSGDLYQHLVESGHLSPAAKACLKEYRKTLEATYRTASDAWVAGPQGHAAEVEAQRLSFQHQGRV